MDAEGAQAPKPRRPKGSANPRQKPNGHWEGRYTDRTGRRRSVSAPTKREAERLMVAARKAIDDGLPIAPASLTVGRWLDTWLDGPDVTGLSTSSQKAYRSLCKNHLKPLLGRFKLRELTALNVAGALDAMRRAGKAPATISTVRAILVAALASAERADYVSRNVARLAKGPSVPTAEAPVTTAAEALAILKAVKGNRLEWLFRFLAGSARRVGEALALKWSDVDLAAGKYRVGGTLHHRGGQAVVGPTKTASSKRSHVLTALALEALKAQRAQQRRDRLSAGPSWHDSGHVFTGADGQPLRRANVRRALRICLEAAELPEIRTHDLRHAAATLLRAEGADLAEIQSMLAHKSITSTQRYAHPTDKSDRATAAKLDRALGAG